MAMDVRRLNKGVQNIRVKLTVTIVLLLRSINGSICLQLQVETLSTVELRHNPLQLGLCGGTGRQEDRNETTHFRKT